MADPVQEESESVPEISPEAADFAKRIQFWRNQAGIRKVDLARFVGCEPSMVSKWEAGTLRPGLGYQHEIVKACGISMQIFWSKIPEAE